jgi:hypothetical protein
MQRFYMFELLQITKDIWENLINGDKILEMAQYISPSHLQQQSYAKMYSTIINGTKIDQLACPNLISKDLKHSFQSGMFSEESIQAA